MRKLLTVQELADLLGVKTTWVYEKVRWGKIPTVPNMGRYKRFDPAVINRLFFSGEHSSLKTESSRVILRKNRPYKWEN